MAEFDRPFRITGDTIVLDAEIRKEIDCLGSFPGEGLCELKLRRRESSTVCTGRSCVGCSVQASSGDFCQEIWAIGGESSLSPIGGNRLSDRLE